MPTISVIVPVYGAEQYIEACLRSIAAQTFTDFELLLVDDGSTDRSVEVAENYLNSTSLNWRVLHQENQGLAAARENGIQNARGEWISCIDSDDVVATDFLETLYSTISESGASVSVVGHQMVWNQDMEPHDALPGETRICERHDVLYNFLTRRFIAVLPAFLIQKRLIEQYHIKNDMFCRYSEDAFYLWQVFFASEKIAINSKKLYFYLQRPNSIMSAPKAEHVLTGYRAICSLVEQKQALAGCFPEIRFLLPRWVLGALHGVARYMDYPAFSELYWEMDAREHAKALRDFPEWKARLLARLLAAGARPFYTVIHTMGR